MPILQDILYRVNIRSVQGPLNIEVKSIETDSRKVGPDSAFIAVKGVHADGHQFIGSVVKQGALAVM
jgi:UDP-N-acetylmuramoyl-L-alanyl-D-glutamate--2,6-diaminopimelate ligase